MNAGHSRNVAEESLSFVACLDTILTRTPWRLCDILARQSLTSASSEPIWIQATRTVGNTGEGNLADRSETSTGKILTVGEEDGDI